MKELVEPIDVIGVELRTTNDNCRAFEDIPPFWESFMKNNMVTKIPNKQSDDVYAIYTNFENQGKNNKGMYSLIIGCAVKTGTKNSEGFAKVKIPTGQYRIFPVPKSRPDKVGEVWQDIWAIPDSEKKNWRFECEFERYHPSGDIDIYIGLK